MCVGTDGRSPLRWCPTRPGPQPLGELPRQPELGERARAGWVGSAAETPFLPPLVPRDPLCGQEQVPVPKVILRPYMLVHLGWRLCARPRPEHPASPTPATAPRGPVPAPCQVTTPRVREAGLGCGSRANPFSASSPPDNAWALWGAGRTGSTNTGSRGSREGFVLQAVSRASSPWGRTP